MGLVKGVEEEALICGFGASHGKEFEVESAGRRYDSMVMGGKLRAAVWMITARDPGGLFKPHNRCSKTGHPVIDVLREKHPEAVVPRLEDFDAYPDDEDSLESMPISCFKEQVAKAAARLSGNVAKLAIAA